MNKYSLHILHTLCALVLITLYGGNVESAEEHRGGGIILQTIYIGVPGNRYPYSYVDNANNLRGVLLDKIGTVCNKAGLKCNFIYGSFHNNLEKLNDFKIDAALIIDSVVLPDHDEVKLTSPLCKHDSILIKKVSSNTEKEFTKKDLQNALIGVPYGSLFHLYALENYYSFASIKPYETIESGIFDVFSERIDFLFTEETVYDALIDSTFLGSGHKNSKQWLEKLRNTSVKLPGALMTIAVKDNNDELMAKLASAVTEKDATLPCRILLELTDNDKPPLE